MALVCDVTQEQQVEQVMSSVADAWGGLDVVVSNAGVQLLDEDARVHELDVDVFDRTHAVNLRGAFLV